jgi:outer membrane protein TolC
MQRSVQANVFLLAALCAGGCTSVPTAPREGGVGQDAVVTAEPRGENFAGWGTLVGRPALDTWIRNSSAAWSGLAVSRAAVRASASGVDLARADRRPSVEAELAGRAGQQKNRMTGFEAEELNAFAASGQATWELDVFGRIAREVDAAEFKKRATVYRLRARELDFASELAQRYVQGLFRTAQLLLRNEAVEARVRVTRYEKSRAKAGLARAQDAERAAAGRSVAEARRLKTREDLAVLGARWAYIVDTNTVPSLSSVTGTNMPALPALSHTGNLHGLAVNRPDVQAAYAVWRGAASSAESAVRSRLPTVAAVVTGTLNGPSPVEDPDEWLAWAGARLSLPVLAPHSSAKAEEARGEAGVRAALYHDAVRRALLQLRESYEQRVHADRRRREAQSASESLKARFESEQRRFRQGLVTVPAVEEARLAWLDANDQALALYAATLERHIEFVRAAGGP